MKHTILRVFGFFSDSLWLIPLLPEDKKQTLDKIIDAIPDCRRFQAHWVYKDLRNFCKEHGKKISWEEAQKLLAEDKPENPLVVLLREWKQRMGSLQQDDYDVLCKETDRILEDEASKG
jgi:hypothetical protein